MRETPRRTRSPVDPLRAFWNALKVEERKKKTTVSKDSSRRCFFNRFDPIGTYSYHTHTHNIHCFSTATYIIVKIILIYICIIIICTCLYRLVRTRENIVRAQGYPARRFVPVNGRNASLKLIVLSGDDERQHVRCSVLHS